MTPSIQILRNGGVDEMSDSSQLSTTPEHGARKPTPSNEEPLREKLSLVDRAHAELEDMLERCNSHSDPEAGVVYREPFPVACKDLLHSLPGNRSCVDCPTRDPEWAAVSYGALVCIKCSGRHRSLGVAISQVRSVSMDHWTHKEVVMMLEGGNAQLEGFFARNCLTKKEFQKREKITEEQQQRNRSVAPRGSLSLTSENVSELRYKTKAAVFYRSQLEAHVGRLLEDPARKPYRGR
mmetsp:Transcript_24844/g.58288  ORF Transcript_24844/g.58288 Transcript_24844/m.58288 type:complete len:237 (+) Transcript_24844:92-802(+)